MLMVEPRVWVFFYGSYMNFDVLKELGLVPEQWEVARADGFDIIIQPRANLIRSDRRCVYGILVKATHDELNRLYAHAKGVLGETYFPEAILVETLSGTWRPALCYIAPLMEARPAARDYVGRIVKPVKEFNFPSGTLSGCKGSSLDTCDSRSQMNTQVTQRCLTENTQLARARRNRFI